MSDSVRSHRWQPTRLPIPLDSPGKNTGVVCHVLLQCRKVKSLSRVLATPWTTAYQAPPSMGFSRQEYWSRVPLPSLRTIYTHMQISVYKMWNLSRIVPKPVPCGLTELQIYKRSLVGYSPWSRKESDITERTHTRLKEIRWSMPRILCIIP